MLDLRRRKVCAPFGSGNGSAGSAGVNIAEASAADGCATAAAGSDKSEPRAVGRGIARSVRADAVRLCNAASSDGCATAAAGGAVSASGATGSAGSASGSECSPPSGAELGPGARPFRGPCLCLAGGALCPTSTLCPTRCPTRPAGGQRLVQDRRRRCVCTSGRQRFWKRRPHLRGRRWR